MLNEYYKKPVIRLFGGVTAAALFGVILLFGSSLTGGGPSVAWATPVIPTCTIVIYAKLPDAGSRAGHAFFKIKRVPYPTITVPHTTPDAAHPGHSALTDESCYYINRKAGFYPSVTTLYDGWRKPTIMQCDGYIKDDTSTSVSSQFQAPITGGASDWRPLYYGVILDTVTTYDLLSFNCTHAAIGMFNYTDYQIPLGSVDELYDGHWIPCPSGLVDYIEDVLNE